MFNRSKKYILLLIVNIIIIVAAFVNFTRPTDDPFDTEYVIGLLENEQKFKNSIREMEFKLLAANEREDRVQEQLEQTQFLINRSEQKFKACEIEKQGIINDAKVSLRGNNSATSLQCSSQIVELSAATNKVKVLEQRLSKIGVEYTQIQEELFRTKQLLAQAQDQNKIEIESLRKTVRELEYALNEPIKIQKNYISARFCSKPKFEELICVQEFLVRPTFTKTPITRLGIKLIDPKGSVVAEGEYNSAKSQLYRLTMGRGKEVASGMYRAVYSIDNQTLRSEHVNLSQ